MTKQHDKSCTVDSASGIPRRFRWRRRTYRVQEVLGSWIESEPWWAGHSQRLADLTSATERQVWRVLASSDRSHGCAGVYEISQHGTGGRWVLDRVWD